MRCDTGGFCSKAVSLNSTQSIAKPMKEGFEQGMNGPSYPPSPQGWWVPAIEHLLYTRDEQSTQVGAIHLSCSYP